jgi:cyclopropane-fatty-acyl-phospholipid synthase
MDRRLLRLLARTMRDLPVRFELWDGEGVGPDEALGGVRVRLGDRGALYRLLLDPMLQFGELYSSGRIRIDGDLPGLLEEVYRRDPRRGILQRVRAAVTPVIRAAPDLAQARRNIHHHYDIGNDFYELWLDAEALQYTCAYYATPDMTLVQAQQAKMHHVCRKVWLKPGESVVETGFGWGGFALFMAREYGVRVRAFNISAEQVAYARDWARRESLDDRIEFIEDDYRNAAGRYDAFLSIGMLEHVGPGNYQELGRIIDRCLKPDGRGLIHSIGRDRILPTNPWIRKRIFPGAYPPTLREMMAIIEPAGFSVLDVENLRMHYARTLQDWLANFEEHRDPIETMFDAAFVRAWRLYLTGSMTAFTSGSLQLYQVVFARGGFNDIPWTRAHVYPPPHTPP